MNITKIIGLALIGGAVIGATSCEKDEARYMRERSSELLEEVMADRPQRELDKIRTTVKGELVAPFSQRAADSIVFRNMFIGTQKANDSEFIADYNKMIAKTKDHFNFRVTGVTEENIKIKDKLREVLTVSEMKKINQNPLMDKQNYYSIGRQYLLDSVYHHKLFEKHNMLDEKGMKQFKQLCKKVRP